MQKESGGIGTMIRMMPSMSYDRKDYDSAQDFLSKVMDDYAWKGMLQQLQDASPNELKKFRELGIEEVKKGVPGNLWLFSNHQVECVVTDIWNEGQMLLLTLKSLTVWMLSLVWIEQNTKTAEADGAAHAMSERCEEMFHFVHPEIYGEEAWGVHDAVKRLVVHQRIPEICAYLKELKQKSRVMLPSASAVMYKELVRMGMPTGEGYSEKHFTNCYTK